MKPERLALAVAILAIIVAVWSRWEISNLRTRLNALSQSASQARVPNASSQATNVEQRLAKLEAVTPDVGQSMLSIQVHFAKLYYAAEARNWDLARFEHEEIEEDLKTVAALKPEDRDVNLAGLISGFKETQLAALKEAIDVSDRPLFRKAYLDTAAICNGCHQATGRPFLYITIPTNAPVSNQRWEPTAETVINK